MLSFGTLLSSSNQIGANTSSAEEENDLCPPPSKVACVYDNRRHLPRAKTLFAGLDDQLRSISYGDTSLVDTRSSDSVDAGDMTTNNGEDGLVPAQEPDGTQTNHLSLVPNEILDSSGDSDSDSASDTSSCSSCDSDEDTSDATSSSDVSANDGKYLHNTTELPSQTARTNDFLLTETAQYVTQEGVSEREDTHALVGVESVPPLMYDDGEYGVAQASPLETSQATEQHQALQHTNHSSPNSRPYNRPSHKPVMFDERRSSSMSNDGKESPRLLQASQVGHRVWSTAWHESICVCGGFGGAC
ncbi:hypothetical protein L7F22_063277 [Adiantum nelumboides]|nr:hypothetical protein [Adiantum nelumboides]